MIRTGINAKDISSINRGLILQYLATANHPVTRSELTKLTGLSKMTVSNIVNEFLANEIIVEKVGKDAPISRSNPALLEISPNAPKLIGVRIRHHSCIATLCDIQLKTISTSVISVDLEQLHSGEELMDILVELIAPLTTKDKILAIGIGSIGPVVDPVTGVARYPYNWGIIPFRSYIESKLHIPVFIENTHNCAIWAEQIYGSAKEYHDFVQLGMASGFSLGVVIHNQLHSSLTGQIGHMCIDPHGPMCHCGNRGCLEAHIGVRIIQKAVAETTGQEMTFAEICENSKNPAIHQILMRNLMDYLVIAMVNAAQLLNPEVFYVADELVRLPDRYLTYLEQILNDRLASRNYRYIKVLRPKISTENTAAFCAITVVDSFFQNGLLDF